MLSKFCIKRQTLARACLQPYRGLIFSQSYHFSTIRCEKFTISERKDKDLNKMPFCELIPYFIEGAVVKDMTLSKRNTKEDPRTIFDIDKNNVLKSFINLPKVQKKEFLRSFAFELFLGDIFSVEEELEKLSLSDLEIRLRLCFEISNSHTLIERIFDLILRKDLLEDFKSSSQIMVIIQKFCKRYKENGTILNLIEKYLELIRLTVSYSSSMKKMSTADFAQVAAALLRMGKMNETEKK